MATVVAAALGAACSLVAYVGKLTGRLAERGAGRVYYVSYAFTLVALLLFIARGCRGGL